jgi:hypothetical protein
MDNGHRKPNQLIFPMTADVYKTFLLYRYSRVIKIKKCSEGNSGVSGVSEEE